MLFACQARSGFCENVARLVWFCGAARVAFLRATGSPSVLVRLNANFSYSLLLTVSGAQGLPLTVGCGGRVPSQACAHKVRPHAGLLIILPPSIQVRTSMER